MSIGEGTGNPLQRSCLENPRDGGPGGLPSLGSQSRTRLKQLSSVSICHKLSPLKWLVMSVHALTESKGRRLQGL